LCGSTDANSNNKTGEPPHKKVGIERKMEDNNSKNMATHTNNPFKYCSFDPLMSWWPEIMTQVQHLLMFHQQLSVQIFGWNQYEDRCFKICLVINYQHLGGGPFGKYHSQRRNQICQLLVQSQGTHPACSRSAFGNGLSIQDIVFKTLSYLPQPENCQMLLLNATMPKVLCRKSWL
jgi:hypothetical protein